MKVSRKFKLLVFLSISCCAIAVHFYLPRFITEIKNPAIRFITGKNYEAKHQFNAKKGTFINFESFDGTLLSAFFTPSVSNQTKGTILLLHGIRGTKEHFIALSDTLSKLGYNAVALDSRAHGVSKGTHCTFGVKEKQDVSRLIDELYNSFNGVKTKPIGIWGQSLGGAIALQAMGVEQRIKFGIVESTFTDLKSITNDYFGYHVGFNVKPFTNYMLQRAGRIANFNPEDAKPVRFCKTIKQPIVLVHGTEDKRIDIAYAKTNFGALKSKHKSFIRVDGANHLNVWEVGGTQYFNSIKTFLAQAVLQ